MTRKQTIDNYRPERIFVLKGYEYHEVTENVRERYPDAHIEVTDSQDGFGDDLEDREIGSLVDWGKKTLVLGEAQKFISPSKGQPVHYCKGPRKIIPISNGCHYSCQYCFMQGTYRGRHPRVKFNLNWEKLLKEIDRDIAERVVLGTQVYHMGENQDSLAFDYIYPLTRILVPFFAKRDARLLLLSKSDCVDNLLDLEHNEHTIVSWSINSDHVTRNIELDTAPLYRRIGAAKKAQEAGYPLRLRFDPLLLLSGKEWRRGDWKKRYNRMMDAVFRDLRPERVTMGSLRFHPTIRASATQRFPNTVLFDDDLLSDDPDEDHRYRYRDDIRVDLYRHIVDCIRERAEGDISIGLCKETDDMWTAVGLELDRKKPTCHCQL